MTVIEVKENGAIRTKMLSCDSPMLFWNVSTIYDKLLMFGASMKKTFALTRYMARMA